MKKVLFIEDDAATAKAYESKFSKDYTTAIAYTGHEGLSRAVSESPDVIVLDIMLPGGMNGFDVLKELKRRPETEKVPVIVLTNLEGQESAALDFGASVCLLKANTKIEEVEKTVFKYTQ